MSANELSVSSSSSSTWWSGYGGVIPPPPDILEEFSCPFIGIKRRFYVKETFNGQNFSLDKIQKVYSRATGNNFCYFLNHLKSTERERIKRKSLDLSPGWHEAVVVEESRYMSVPDQDKLVKVEGYGLWKAATAAQIMYVDVEASLSGQSFVGDLWARGSDKPENGYYLVILGSSFSSPPQICHDYGYAHKSVVVVAIRELKAFELSPEI